MTKKTTRTRAEAKRLMWEFYKENKSALPQSVSSHREQIINLIEEGLSAIHAFREACNLVMLDTHCGRQSG